MDHFVRNTSLIPKNDTSPSSKGGNKKNAIEEVGDGGDMKDLNKSKHEKGHVNSHIPKRKGSPKDDKGEPIGGID
jgi:hypothetical protein